MTKCLCIPVEGQTNINIILKQIIYRNRFILSILLQFNDWINLIKKY